MKQKESTNHDNLCRKGTMQTSVSFHNKDILKIKTTLNIMKTVYENLTAKVMHHDDRQRLLF